MKILKLIPNGDYESVVFENGFSGKPVTDLIKKVEAGEILSCEDDDGEEITFGFKVFEVGEISDSFLSFVRNEVQDEDDAKHSNFYVENSVV